MKYPFSPKSTSYLKPGQYWSIPLEEGRFACGVVLARLVRGTKINPRLFYAGLVHWVGTSAPETTAIARKDIIFRGALHVEGIRRAGGELLGEASFAAMPTNPLNFSDDIHTLGYEVLGIIAQKKLVENDS